MGNRKNPGVSDYRKELIVIYLIPQPHPLLTLERGEEEKEKKSLVTDSKSCPCLGVWTQEEQDKFLKILIGEQLT